MNDLQKHDNLADLWSGVKIRAIAARSSATRRAYRYDWDQFVDFCDSKKISPLPATSEVIALYVTHLDEINRAPASIDRAVVSLSQAHKLANLPSPTTAPIVREVLKGVKRTRRVAQKKAAPITLEHLRRMISFCENDAMGARDRALLLIGWSAALRRSEIVALDVGDLQSVSEGLVLNLKRSKTDQEGKGRKIGIPFGEKICAVCAVRKWKDLSKISKGPLFRRIFKGGAIGKNRLIDRSVNLVIKRLAAAAGYDPDTFSGHSLRSGFATSAAAAGIEERLIMGHTGHKSVKIARDYIRDGSLFKQNPLEILTK